MFSFPQLPGSSRKAWTAGIAGLCGAALVAGTVVWLWPSSEAGAPAPTARTYRDVDVCLLTDARGVVPGSPGASVWAGMRDASDRVRARVSFLQALGPDTEENAVPYLNSLVQEHCAVIVAVGASEDQAVRAVAGDQPATRFVVVGDGTSDRNVSMVRPGEDARVRSEVGRIVGNLVNSVSGS